MRKDIYDHEVLMLRRRELRFWIILFILSFVTLGQTYLLNKKSVQTILIPPSLDLQYILDYQTSPLYLESFGIYFSHLLMNYTPDDVEVHFSHILLHTDPSGQNAIKSFLSQQMKFVKSKEISQRLIINKTKVVNSKVYIYGLVERSLGLHTILSTNVEIEIEFSIDPGSKMLKIKGLRTCDL